MPLGNETNQQILSLFAEQPCWMIGPLADEVNYSIPSVRRFLLELGYHNSFTNNGRWYTLRSMPRFNRDGLWFYNGIGFSRAGTLTNTLVSLATRSPAGMSADQLGEKLHCRCHAVLVQLYRQGKLQRQKLGRSYVYISGDQNKAATQCQSMRSAPAVPLPAEIIVMVLVEFIKNPRFSFEQLAAEISHKKGISVSVTQVERIFEIHSLKKKR